jgi:hypothetical protein
VVQGDALVLGGRANVVVYEVLRHGAGEPLAVVEGDEVQSICPCEWLK